MSADEFAKKIQSGTEYSVRPTCIGHVQRGGSPMMADRMLAAQFGNKAVRLLNEGIGNRAVGIKDNKIIDMDIIEAVSMKKVFNYELYETLQMISM
jgi:6-phosphofructokinase 1